jgi:outer membrane lipoprotein carrier protein
VSRAPLVAAIVFVAAPLAARAQDTASAFDRTARLYGAATTIRAKFDQRLVMPPSKEEHNAVGEYLQRGKTRFALRYSEPAGDAIVFDGTALWVYLPSAAPGQVMKVPAELAGGLDLLAELFSSPHERYVIRPGPAGTVGGHAVASYTLVPRAQNAPFTRAVVSVGRDDAILWKVQIDESGGQLRRMQFRSVQFDAAIPDALLSFKVPDGVRVIDQAAMLGGKPE